MSIYAKYGRYRSLFRLRYSTKFMSFLIAQAARLGATGTPTTVSFTFSSNYLNLTAHGYVDGQGPFLLANSGGALPPELDGATSYWVNAATPNAVTLHLTKQHAIDGTNIVAISGDGTGTQTILVGADTGTIFDALSGGKSADEIRSIANIDNL